MATNEDFGDFTVELERKPVGGVTMGEIPPKLAELLAEHAPKALADPDFEVVLKAADEAQAKRLKGYATAWGARQEPKLYITKATKRRDESPNVVRLNIRKDEEVAPENRVGRRGNRS